MEFISTKDMTNETAPAGTVLVKYLEPFLGGFPCQDISIANINVKGIKGNRSGLWSEMFRIIRLVRPKYVIIENSPMLLVRGFERVLCDLSEIGFNAEWQTLSAEAFGYCHKRERLYCIAFAFGRGINTQQIV